MRTVFAPASSAKNQLNSSKNSKLHVLKKKKLWERSEVGRMNRDVKVWCLASFQLMMWNDVRKKRQVLIHTHVHPAWLSLSPSHTADLHLWLAM